MTSAEVAIADNRPYVAMHHNGAHEWLFMALEGGVFQGHHCLLETWNDRYEICRAMYTKDDAVDFIRKKTSGGMLNGPDLFCIFDKGVACTRAILTVWISSVSNSAHVQFYDISNDPISIECVTSFEVLKQKCLDLLKLQRPIKVDIVKSSAFLKDIIIRKPLNLKFI